MWLAVAFSIVAAWFAARAKRSQGETPEGVTGIIFILASALSLLLVAHSPHGLEEVHRLLSSSLIGAQGADLRSFVRFRVSDLTGAGSQAGVGLAELARWAVKHQALAP